MYILQACRESTQSFNSTIGFDTLQQLAQKVSNGAVAARPVCDDGNVEDRSTCAALHSPKIEDSVCLSGRVKIRQVSRSAQSD